MSANTAWIWTDLADRYTPHELTILERVLRRPCPTCEAPVGCWCRTKSGKEIRDMDEQHPERRILAPATAPADREPLGTHDVPVDDGRA
ncbi:zinc finger domain-containing protein [Actinopolymorpha pittospori]|uniref:DNA-binding phage zinc finger domain-containing protein n=1 Tax=Actinopolymorpha pittospori TaxID=648752 RepID=A0A927N0L9_9ACTN|nr:hypothetical protein [Actinopolymorpha pittospori]MBE1608128.1 hypothetical protein [Actinopolymorpha pittospori]